MSLPCPIMLNSSFPETNFLVDITDTNSNTESNYVMDSTVTNHVEFPNCDDLPDLMLPRGLAGYSSHRASGECVSQTLDRNQYVAGDRRTLGMGDLPRNHEEGKKRSKMDAVQKIAFRTKSWVEVMDDGFKWRKYGKKVVKNSPYPRNYYKCVIEGCNVKKRVERDGEDSSYVLTKYEGVHNHACN